VTSDRAERSPWLQSKARHVYVAYVRVRHHELDSLGHDNNATSLNYLEQAAINHAAPAGYPEDTFREGGGELVARRHEIDYLQPAKANDLLLVVTWHLDLGAARGGSRAKS
jgi:acyl-CoA thioester hydrolase